MKTKIFLSVILLAVVSVVNAQYQSDTLATYRTVIPIEKQSLMKNIDIITNIQTGFRSDFIDGEHQSSQFKFEQFRLEIKGYVHEKIYFRFRHRYTSTFDPQSIDKIIKGVDFAYFRFDLTDKLQFTLGKTYADWGGIEFDLNPIDIYEYSDIIEMADNFLTGAGLTYHVTKKHNITVQILDTRTSTFNDIYGAVPGIEQSEVPLAGVLNWRGSFLDGKLSTLWSYSYFNEGKITASDKSVGKNYIALGQLYKMDKLYIAYDYKLSMEGLDRTGIISGDIPDNLYAFSVENTMYQSHWTRINYEFMPKWHVSLDAFIDFAYWKDDIDPFKTEDKFRTAISYVPTIEYFPWDDINLKFFVGYVGRHYMYSDYAKTRPGMGLDDFSTGRAIIGIITPLHVL